jgi:hypothetical protein
MIMDSPRKRTATRFYRSLKLLELGYTTVRRGPHLFVKLTAQDSYLSAVRACGGVTVLIKIEEGYVDICRLATDGYTLSVRPGGVASAPGRAVTRVRVPVRRCIGKGSLKALEGAVLGQIGEPDPLGEYESLLASVDIGIDRTLG